MSFIDNKLMDFSFEHRKKLSKLFSWGFSNLFAILFPVGAIFFAENFKVGGNFEIKNHYPEMLMVTISICVNLLMQLNSDEYHIDESKNTYIRVITVGVLVLSSLIYGVSKTIPPENLETDKVYTCSLFFLIFEFILGLICESFRRLRS